MPVHFLWFKDKLAKGFDRKKIAATFSEKYGGNERTTFNYLNKYFPKNLTPENALWAYRHAVKTAEQRSERAKRGAAALSPEQRSERAKRAAAALSPEQRSERARKIGESVKRAAAALSPEQRSERARKASVSRRNNLVKDISYIENLPRVDVLSERETADKFRELSTLINPIVGKFRRRGDFEDIKGVVNLAVFEALARWDGKTVLEKLVADSIKLHLIDYFGNLKKWNINEIPFADINSVDRLVNLKRRR